MSHGGMADKYFAFSPIKYSSTSSTDKIVLKYKYKYRYLTTTLELTAHTQSVNQSDQINYWLIKCYSVRKLSDFNKI